ncbi:MAG: recombination protein RecR [Ruminococcaceae bacterium]|nr:recombination protein RecR [Oscillospiraceae bacterium]
MLLSLEILTEQMRRLPGVGNKTALKYALSILEMDEMQAQAFVSAVESARRNIRRCDRCFNLSEGICCSVCEDASRSDAQICVVEDARAVMAMERVSGYKGRYHVLEGVISPMDGVGPDDLRICELLERVNAQLAAGECEVIVATNSTVEGETTAMYLTKLLKPLGAKVTRLAYGIPVGADLEYADEVTLGRAIEGRREI